MYNSGADIYFLTIILYMAVNVKRHSDWIQKIGDKVRQGAEIAGTVKGIWDTGKMIYGGIQTIAPYVAAAAAAV
jgi:hypothetical protein